MSKSQLDALIEKLETIETQKKELEKQADAIKDAIKKDLGKQETKETGRYVVRYTTYTTDRFDTKSFKEKHPRLFQAFITVTSARRFSYVAK